MREKIVLVLVGNENKNVLRNALKYCGWCEFRVDEFLKKFPEEKLIPWISFKTDAKKIGTVRWRMEHQEKRLPITEKRRLKIYKDIIEYVDYVDIEIRSSIVKDVIEEARRKNKKVIVSYHNFLKTPSSTRLEDIYKKGRKLKPDIIKIATKVNSPDELFTLLSFTYKYSKKFPLVITPMGVSFVERFVPLYLGSLFTYVALTEKTAQGQITCKDVVDLQNKYGII